MLQERVGRSRWRGGDGWNISAEWAARFARRLECHPAPSSIIPATLSCVMSAFCYKQRQDFHIKGGMYMELLKSVSSVTSEPAESETFVMGRHRGPATAPARTAPFGMWHCHGK
ncbi:hypothetical protein J6590_050167 [Homalodisca vitripennis]|nr:hypothetical protein J6590_050167 [Homalodisca vitripennis]